MGSRAAGKTVIVTGAAQGVGAAHAHAPVAEGAKVVLSDVDERHGSAVALSPGDHPLFVEHDVTSEQSWSGLVDATEARFRSVSVLVNNVGIGPELVVDGGLSSEH
jgi:3alpha(or 20beta)-hydroxysteroid dehydrogenase